HTDSFTLYLHDALPILAILNEYAADKDEACRMRAPTSGAQCRLAPTTQRLTYLPGPRASLRRGKGLRCALRSRLKLSHEGRLQLDRKSTRLNSSHVKIS